MHNQLTRGAAGISDRPTSVVPVPPRLFIDHLDRGYDSVIASGFEFLGPSGRIGNQDRVVLKPNLTFPTYQPGVMTTPAAIEAVIRYVRNFTDKVTLCEADSGGYNPFCMDEVFRSTGLQQMAARYGVKLVNLSREDGVDVMVPTRLRKVRVPVPRMLLEETDLFITIPVPKVHANTVISVAIKNQWGTIQAPHARLRLHPYFREVIYFMNTIYPRMIAVVDGNFGLTRNGPMRGDAVPLNWMMISDDIFLTDSVVAGIMGYSRHEIPYLDWILRRNPVHPDPVFNTDWSEFRKTGFRLDREWTDYPGLFTFRSRALAWLGYESPLAAPLHRLLYLFRKPFY